MCCLHRDVKKFQPGGASAPPSTYLSTAMYCRLSFHHNPIIDRNMRSTNHVDWSTFDDSRVSKFISIYCLGKLKDRNYSHGRYLHIFLLLAAIACFPSTLDTLHTSPILNAVAEECGSPWAFKVHVISACASIQANVCCITGELLYGKLHSTSCWISLLSRQ